VLNKDCHKSEMGPDASFSVVHLYTFYFKYNFRCGWNYYLIKLLYGLSRSAWGLQQLSATISVHSISFYWLHVQQLMDAVYNCHFLFFGHYNIRTTGYAICHPSSEKQSLETFAANYKPIKHDSILNKK